MHTIDWFLERLKEKHRDVEITGEYVNTETKIAFKCNVCNYEGAMQPFRLIKNGCRNCSIQNGNQKKRKTHEEFIKVASETNPNFTIIGKYINCKTKIKYICNVCNNENEVLPAGLLKGNDCPVCSNRKRYKTHEQFIEELKEINPNLVITSKYERSSKKVSYTCKLCEYKGEATPNGLLSGHGCARCSKMSVPQSREKAYEDFMQKIAQINPNIEIIGEYVNATTKLAYRCKRCQEISYSDPSHLITGRSCPLCAIKDKANARSKTHEQFVKELAEINPDIEIIGVYTRTKLKIEYRCRKCLNVNSAIPANLLRGSSCPVCNESRGERQIRNYLNKNNIEFTRQKRFEGCENKKALLFDFYLKDYNLCIEYQGIQHYEPVDFASKGKEWADENFALNQQRDQIKRDYCATNNINLLEIPYWDFDNIETILEKELKECICA